MNFENKTLVELQTLLKENGLSPYGLPFQLIARLEEYYQTPEEKLKYLEALHNVFKAIETSDMELFEKYATKKSVNGLMMDLRDTEYYGKNKWINGFDCFSPIEYAKFANKDFVEKLVSKGADPKRLRYVKFVDRD